jgi:acyl-CoA reductase-like NAD-dependent aldehyde dehydrogenase
MQNIEVYNPASPEELVWSGTETALDQLPGIAEAAKKSQKEWKALTGRQRLDILTAFLDGIEERTSDLADCMVRELGKLRGEAIGEVGKSLVEARWMLGRCLEKSGKIMASARPGIRSMVIRRPRGVVLAITPWNFPILTPLRKITPALVFGNAILLKPSVDAPGTAMILQQVADQSLPKGLLTVIMGGADIASAAIRCPQVDVVTFTGSTQVGHKVMLAAAEGLKEVSLELGGKNPAIVHDAVNMEKTIDDIVRAAFANTGQRCTAISRVLVQQELREPFLNSLLARMKLLIPGPSSNDESTLGPLSTKAQYDKVCEFLKNINPEQTDILTGGSPVDLPGGGYFFEPTLVEVTDSKCEINFSEIFGPVLGVEFYEKVDDAISRANATEYGLTSSIFASDISVIRAFEEGIESGMLHINHGTFPDENMPFGGWKASGVGAPSVGEESEQFYTRVQAIYEGV